MLRHPRRPAQKLIGTPPPPGIFFLIRACFYKMFAKIRPLKMRISTFNFAVIAIHSKSVSLLASKS